MIHYMASIFDWNGNAGTIHLDEFLKLDVNKDHSVLVGSERNVSLLEFIVVSDRTQAKRHFVFTGYQHAGSVKGYQYITSGGKFVIFILDGKARASSIPPGFAIRGKRFALTGTLSKTRNEVYADIEANGGHRCDSVTGRTDYLVVGEDPGYEKVSAAKERQIPIIRGSDFEKILNKLP